MKRGSKKLLFLLLITVATATSCLSCSSISYYQQSISGHLALMKQRVPLTEVIAATQQSDPDNGLFERLLTIRSYASESLALPGNDSYTKYVKLESDSVVWNVVATPEFSLSPVKWCFPVAGCVSYRGYYIKADAEKYAQRLKNKGHDVRVWGASAYSTLGWFDDPVFSSMLRRGETHYAETVFHELAHQQLYVKNDSAFNEAFATTVGEQGVRKWLSDTGKSTLPYDKVLKREHDFRELLSKTVLKLKSLYADETDPLLLKQRKKQHFKELKNNYQSLKINWGGYSGYDSWFLQPLNNAHLASVSTYHEKVPDMVRLFKLCGGDFDAFYKVMQTLSREDKKNRNVLLQSGNVDCE